MRNYYSGPPERDLETILKRFKHTNPTEYTVLINLMNKYKAKKLSNSDIFKKILMIFQASPDQIEYINQHLHQELQIIKKKNIDEIFNELFIYIRQKYDHYFKEILEVISSIAKSDLDSNDPLNHQIESLIDNLRKTKKLPIVIINDITNNLSCHLAINQSDNQYEKILKTVVPYQGSYDYNNDYEEQEPRETVKRPRQTNRGNVNNYVIESEGPTFTETVRQGPYISTSKNEGLFFEHIKQNLQPNQYEAMMKVISLFMNCTPNLNKESFLSMNFS